MEGRKILDVQEPLSEVVQVDGFEQSHQNLNAPILEHGLVRELMEVLRREDFKHVVVNALALIDTCSHSPMLGSR